MAELYQLRVVLRDVSPLVWRRLLINSETSLAQLHELLLLTFGWSGEHLHLFHIHGRGYGVSQYGGIAFSEDARCVRLSRFRLHHGEWFRYEYDFTAGWALDVRLERALPWDGNRILPVCTGGSRAAPPDDCGGALDYLERMDSHRRGVPIEDFVLMTGAMQRLLDSGGDRSAMGDLEELREALDRVTAYHDFQPARFDRREANRQIQTLWQDRSVRL
jgi:hypothetical protein